jgi:hypothetical protein
MEPHWWNLIVELSFSLLWCDSCVKIIAFDFFWYNIAFEFYLYAFQFLGHFKFEPKML